ncbi:hypothetical protein M9Y10_028549 [Tritrichomonas musculus]|uniref:peptidyl-tRNA hydrolase n=1 Tax=Tritrichomonas musculus TaxID=1915356 RepID=A0ABR2KJU6_9EUKA
MIPVFAGGLACGIGISYLIERFFVFDRDTEDQTVEQNSTSKYVIPEPEEETDEDFKLVIGIRTDLKFKLYDNATILGDVVIQAIKNAVVTENPSLPSWYYFGQAKICVKVPSEEEMQSLINNLNQTQIPYVTKVNENNQTIAIAIGPAPVALVDSVSRHLKLM